MMQFWADAIDEMCGANVVTMTAIRNPNLLGCSQQRAIETVELGGVVLEAILGAKVVSAREAFLAGRWPCYHGRVSVPHPGAL